MPSEEAACRTRPSPSLLPPHVNKNQQNHPLHLPHQQLLPSATNSIKQNKHPQYHNPQQPRPLMQPHRQDAQPAKQQQPRQARCWQMHGEEAACRSCPFPEHLRRNGYFDFRGNFPLDQKWSHKILFSWRGIVTLCCTRHQRKCAWERMETKLFTRSHAQTRENKSTRVRTIFKHDHIIRPIKCHPHAINPVSSAAPHIDDFG